MLGISYLGEMLVRDSFDDTKKLHEVNFYVDYPIVGIRIAGPKCLLSGSLDKAILQTTLTLNPLHSDHVNLGKLLSFSEPQFLLLQHEQYDM